MGTAVERTYAVRLVVENGGAVKAELSEVGASGEKSLKQIASSGESTAKALEGLVERASEFSKEIKLLGVAAASAASIGGLALMTEKALANADAVAKASEKVGISTKAYQELSYAALQSGVEQESFNNAITKFTKNIADTAAGTGKAKSAFDVLGVSVTGAQGNIKGTETVLDQVADALSGVQDPAERVRLTFDLFGKDGTAMVNMLSNGSAAMNVMRQRAEDLGIVLDEDMIKNAEKAHDDLETLSKVVTANLSAALISLAPLISAASKELAVLAADAGEAVEKIKLFFSGDFQLKGLSFNSVKRDLTDVNNQIDQLQKKIAERQNDTDFFAQGDIQAWTNYLQFLEQERSKLVLQYETLQAQRKAATGGDTDAQTNANIEAQVQQLEAQAKQVESLKGSLDQALFDFEHTGADKINAEYDKLVDQIDALKNNVNADEINKLLSEALQVKDYKLKQLADQEADAEDKRAAAAAKAQAAEDQRAQAAYDANEKVADSLQVEIDSLDKSDKQNFIDQATRRLSAEATDEQRQKVEQLAAALYDEKDALEVKRKEEEKRKQLIDDTIKATEDQATAEQKYNDTMTQLNELLKEGAINQQQYAAASKKARDQMLQDSKEWSAGLQRALQSYGDSATNMAQQVQEVTTDAMNNLENVLVQFTTTGKANWKDMVNSMISDVARLLVRTQITGPLANSLNQAFGSLFGSANGNVFSNGVPLHAFANGGVVFQPTIFPMVNGTGLMGEAGPEAVMPLRRLPNGRLGVESSGNRPTYVVQVDASNSTNPAATAQQVEDAVDRALSARVPGIIRTSVATAQNKVIDTWQRRGGKFD